MCIGYEIKFDNHKEGKPKILNHSQIQNHCDQ
jgi:hypothetical protein